MEDFSSEVAKSLVVDPVSVETAVFLEVNMTERIYIHSVDVFNDSVNVVGSVHVPVFLQDICNNIVNHSLSLPNGKARTKVGNNAPLMIIFPETWQVLETTARSGPFLVHIWWGQWPNAIT